MILKIFKKKFIVLVILGILGILFFAFYPTLILATDPIFTATVAPPDITTYGATSWPILVKQIMETLSIVAGIVFVGVILMGGITIITSGETGGEKSVETGKKAVLGGIIGVVIVAIAWGIITFLAQQIQ